MNSMNVMNYPERIRMQELELYFNLVERGIILIAVLYAVLGANKMRVDVRALLASLYYLKTGVNPLPGAIAPLPEASPDVNQAK